jgi:hypothetical protein
MTEFEQHVYDLTVEELKTPMTQADRDLMKLVASMPPETVEAVLAK